MPQSESASDRKYSTSRMSVAKIEDDKPCGTAFCRSIACSGAVKQTKKVSESPLPQCPSGRAKAAPLGESSGTSVLEDLAAGKVTLGVDPKGRTAN
jgi:hypothetical protein